MNNAQQIVVLENSPEFFTKVAVLDDSDELLLEKIRMELGGSVEPVQKTAAEIKSLQKAKRKRLNEKSLDELRSEAGNTWETEPIINLVDDLLEDALEKGATDIHLEPEEKSLRIRFRKDGMLTDYRILPLWISDPILVRLKILAEVDITDKRIPHDGSFIFRCFRHDANVRLSTIPVQCEGTAQEKCVMRLLPLENGQNTYSEQGLAHLGLARSELDFLRQVFESPQGLFLVTGPTGSGKTTTLHAGLEEIIHKQINVTTIEDPVEYSLPGANQVQVNEKCGLTFAQALRSILRQDPDVILVGEIRDNETAQIAIRAAQTGHLVLSTLHTNSARGAYARLRDLGVEDSAIKESLLGIMAQRLVRKCNGEGYRGRIAVTEILKPDGSFVNGTLRESAQRLVQAGVTDLPELHRVLGEF